MEFPIMVIRMLLLFFMSGKGHTALRKSDNTWALDNCRTGKIDLVFVLDPSIVSNFGQCTSDKQTRFFSGLVDLFSPEIKLDRVRVSLLVASKNDENEAMNSSPLNLRIKFEANKNKVDLKTDIENQGLSSEQNTRPMRTIKNIHLFNINETNPIRANATLVIVMFGGRQNMNLSYTDEDLRNDINMSTEGINAKLFMIVVKDHLPDRLKLGINVAAYKVADIRVESLMPTVSLLMCSYCSNGGFGGIIEISIFRAILSVSCYKLEYSGSPLSWIEANKVCQVKNSQLISIERHDELLSLIEEMFNNKIINLSVPDNVKDSVEIYIGLRRLESSVGKRFRWINGHPLVYNQWGPSQPQGGSTFGCVVWNLPCVTHYTNEKEECLTNDTDWTSSSIGTWSTVGCGDARSKFYICEKMLNINTASPSRNKRKFQLPSPRKDSIEMAIKRGEIGFIPGQNVLMSLSSLLKRWKSDGGPAPGYAYVNGNNSQTIPLSEIKLYKCESIEDKLPYTSVCDLAGECPYFIDELFCRKCIWSETECPNSKQCVPTESWCDLYSDCKDGADERNCDTCKHGLCADGRCILKHLFADGEIDCSDCHLKQDNTFEMNYVQANNISHCLFTCNRTQCVYDLMLHNKVKDCTGPEGHIDETVGALESTTCYAEPDVVTSQFSNWGPKCVYFNDVYGDPMGCRNMVHLLECQDVACPEGYYKCPQSYCIPTHYILNGNFDCPHGEDEDSALTFLKCPFYFVCQSRNVLGNSQLCLHPDLVCDGRVDCPDGDDELNCYVSCQEGFRCIAGTVIVYDHKKAKGANINKLISPNTRYLDLSGINLSNHFPNVFLIERINLNEVIMSSCKINNTVLFVTMCNLGTIRKLDLSYNDITLIHFPSVFRCMDNLYYLNLSHNFLLRHFENIESNLNSMRVLDLSYTSLSYLPKEFSFLKDLSYLNLQNTRILDVTFLPPTTIGILDLRGAPINDLPYAGMFKKVIVSTLLFTDSFKLCCPQLHNSSTNLSACVSTVDPFSSCTDLMSSMGLRIILWCASVLAVLGNITVIVYRIFFDRNIFKMAYGHFVTHLGISDFLMGIYLSIIAVADVFYRNIYIWEEWTWRQSEICKFAGFLSTLSTEVSTVFVFLITLDRYLVIRYPFGQFRISGKFIGLCCIATWVIGAAIAMIPLLPCFHYLNAYNTNGMCLGLPLTNKQHAGWKFSVSVFLFFNCFMFSLIVFGQIAIYKTVSAMRMNQSSLTNLTSRRAQDFVMAKNLSLVVVTDFICWFPIGVMGIIVLCGYTIGVEAYAWSAVLVLPINSAINPILYTIPAVIRKLETFKEKVSCSK